MKSHKKAFTLIEILVVIMILALIVSVTAPAGYKLYENVSNFIEKRKEYLNTKQLKYDSFFQQKANIENNITILGVEIE